MSSKWVNGRTNPIQNPIAVHARIWFHIGITRTKVSAFEMILFCNDESIIMPQVNDVQGVRAVARKLLKILREPITLRGRDVTVTGSVGITIAPTDGSKAEVLLRNADLAMYRAKAKGRNNFQFFREDMNAEVAQRLELEMELSKSLFYNWLKIIVKFGLRTSEWQKDA